MSAKVEKYGPIVVSLIVAVYCYSSGITIDMNSDNISDILSAMINVSAIIIGFLSAMISVIIAIFDTKVMKKIQKYDKAGDLNRYIFIPIVLGFIVAFTSIMFFVIDLTTVTVLKLYTSVWMFFLVFFFTATFRIMHILYTIMKNVYSPKPDVPDVVIPNSDDIIPGGIDPNE